MFCRVRRDDRVKCVIEFPDAKTIGTPVELVCPTGKDNEKKKFEFDRVYSPAATQEDVFADTDAIMTSCVDGYNVCIMAYVSVHAMIRFASHSIPCSQIRPDRIGQDTHDDGN